MGGWRTLHKQQASPLRTTRTCALIDNLFSFSRSTTPQRRQRRDGGERPQRASWGHGYVEKSGAVNLSICCYIARDLSFSRNFARPGQNPDSHFDESVSGFQNARAAGEKKSDDASRRNEKHIVVARCLSVADGDLSGRQLTSELLG